jgi:hypothetical protein
MVRSNRKDPNQEEEEEGSIWECQSVRTYIEERNQDTFVCSDPAGSFCSCSTLAFVYAVRIFAMVHGAFFRGNIFFFLHGTYTTPLFIQILVLTGDLIKTIRRSYRTWKQNKL